MATPKAKPTGRLSDLEKGKIIALRDEGMSYGNIAKRVLRSKSTVQSFLERYAERGSAENLPAPGRPRALDQTTRRRLAREALKHQEQTVRELRNTIAPDVSIRTVQRALKEDGIQKGKTCKRV